jgi:allantoinase/DNA mismatch repair protein MutS2
VQQEAKESGARISVETCPHYLAFAAEEIGDGDTWFKCAPPIRDVVNREHLWKALKVNWFSIPFFKVDRLVGYLCFV